MVKKNYLGTMFHSHEPKHGLQMNFSVAAMRLKWNPFNHNSAEGGKMTFANVGAHCDADPAAPEAAPDGVSISQL